MKVLIAIDGSRESSLAIDAAAGLSWPEGSTIELLTVLPTDVELFGGPWPAAAYVQTDEVRARLREEALVNLGESAARLRQGRALVVTTLGEGRPASVIVDSVHANGADLIILGARGHGALERALLGSVSAEVVDQAPCAILVARHEWTQKVLIGTDGSDEAMAAVEFVAGSGLFMGSEIDVLQVVDIQPDWWLGSTPGDTSLAVSNFALVVEDARRHARDVTAHSVARLRAEGLVATPRVREGSVASTIIDEAAAWGADLVVVGTRGHGLLKRMLLGSTARSVLHHAKMSVLVTKSVLVTRDAPSASRSRSDRPSEVPVASAFVLDTTVEPVVAIVDANASAALR